MFLWRWTRSLSTKVPIFQVFGANTDVGKTIITTAIMNACRHRDVKYIKPVQTGFPNDSDAAFVKSVCPNVETDALVTYRRPASPHMTAIEEKRMISDDQIRDLTKRSIKSFVDLQVPSPIIFIETAGGVNSPSMSGSLQCEVFRPFRFPVILVGDSNLGGISTTISAFESLLIRGYDVPFTVMFENESYRNQEIISMNIDSKVFIIPAPPVKASSKQDDLKNMQLYFKSTIKICENIAEELVKFTETRSRKLETLFLEGGDKIWWPFTQHSLVKNPTVIDSAHKDLFSIYDRETESMKEQFDGCGSWWTQGLGHGNSMLSKKAAYAAGRYGHVMSAECIHEPASDLVEELLSTAGNGWAKRVFFSDNGSTAIEVAVKMALAKIGSELSKTSVIDKKIEWNIVGLEGSYHGDTIGAMDLSDPNAYNKNVDWYQGRGMWFSPPTFLLKGGKYRLRIPFNNPLKSEIQFNSMDDIFAGSRHSSDLSTIYRDHIIMRLKKMVSLFQQSSPAGIEKRLGALIIEPLILGAGGMLFIDPLFQKELIDIVRDPRQFDDTSPPLPVIFDEVFVGMYRLGLNLPSIQTLFKSEDPRQSFAPDIACYAKCLTGGLLPLSATLATEEVFDVFRGDSKLEALLHGHSYTAHPIGCAVALASLQEYKRLAASAEGLLTSVWDEKLVREIESDKSVEGVNSLGTVLVVELVAEEKGYLSTAAKRFVDELRTNGIFARPLGNVLYFMSSQNSSKDDLDDILRTIKKSLCILGGNRREIDFN